MKFKCSLDRLAATSVAASVLIAQAFSVGCSSSSDSTAKKPPATTTPPPGTAAKVNWTRQGYDLQSTWNNPLETTITKENVAQLTELWTTSVGGPQGTADSNGTPLIVDGMLYIASGNQVFGMNADTGAIVWQTSYDLALGTSSTLAYDSDVLYMNGSGGGTLYAFSAKDGTQLWNTQYEMHPNATGYGSPIVVGNTVLVGASSAEEFVKFSGATFKGSLSALDKTSGVVLWKTLTANASENGCAIWGTPSVDPLTNIVYAATGNNYTETPGPGSDSLFAFDLETGAIQWHKQVKQGDVYTSLHQVSHDTDFGANPVVFDVGGKKLIAAGQKSGDFYVLDRTTGDIVSTRNLGGGSPMPGGVFQGLGWDGTNVLVACNGASSEVDGGEPSNAESAVVSTLFAIEPLSGDIVWERQLPALAWGPITTANGVGFVAAEVDLEAFDVTNGKKLADWKAAGTIGGGVTIANGHLYFPSGLVFGPFGHKDNMIHALGFKK